MKNLVAVAFLSACMISFSGCGVSDEEDIADSGSAGSTPYTIDNSVVNNALSDEDALTTLNKDNVYIVKYISEEKISGLLISAERYSATLYNINESFDCRDFGLDDGTTGWINSLNNAKQNKYESGGKSCLEIDYSTADKYVGNLHVAFTYNDGDYKGL